MKRNTILLGVALIGTFSLGAMFSPIGQPEAREQAISNNLPVIQTTAADNIPSQEFQNNYTCPVSGNPMGNGTGRMGMGMGGYFAGSLPSIIADTLGMTVDEFQDAMYSNKTISMLVEEKGLTIEELTETILQERKVELENLVKDNSITQEQMDYMLERMETRVQYIVENDSFSPQYGRGMGMGNGRHMNFGNDSLY